MFIDADMNGSATGFYISQESIEVGKVLDARSVLARRYGRQEKGRRLYSVLARRKKGKEKISQIE